MRIPASALLFVVLLAGFVGLLCAFPQPILYDQSFIRGALHPLGAFPVFEDGVMSGLLVRALGLAWPLSETSVNQVVRSLAAVFFSMSALALCLQVLRTERARLLAVLLLFASRFPLLWLSSELFAGGFLTLALALFARGRFRTAGCLLGAFALCKPDLLLAGGAVFCVWLYLAPEARTRRALAASFIGLLAMVSAAGLFFHGAAFFQGHRSWMAFSQHYSDLFARHQFSPALQDEPFGNWERNVSAAFPGVHDIPHMVLRYPLLYLDYVALAQVHFLKRLLALFHFFLIPLGIVFLCTSRRAAVLGASRMRRLLGPALAAVIGILPITLITFVHMRYLARYFPLILVICAFALEDQLPAIKPFWRRLAIGGIALGMTFQVILLARGIFDLTHGANFWVPD